MTNQAENPGTARASGGPRHWHLLPTAFFVIGICSIILVVWVKQLNETERANSALVDSMMDVRDYAATTHLWMEEAIYGDPAVDVKKQLADMDQAVNILNAVLEGGQSEHGMITRPLTDPPLRAQATASLSLFREFKATALARLAHPEVSQIGSPSDQRFDDLYKDIDDSVRRLEGSLEQIRVADYAKSRRLFLGILLTWAVVVISTTAGIWNREARKKQAEDALVRANVKLFSQAEELVEHREHLSEIVQMRTAAAPQLLFRCDVRRAEAAGRWRRQRLGRVVIILAHHGPAAPAPDARELDGRGEHACLHADDALFLVAGKREILVVGPHLLRPGRAAAAPEKCRSAQAAPCEPYRAAWSHADPPC